MQEGSDEAMKGEGWDERMYKCKTAIRARQKTTTDITSLGYCRKGWSTCSKKGGEIA